MTWPGFCSPDGAPQHLIHSCALCNAEKANFRCSTIPAKRLFYRNAISFERKSRRTSNSPTALLSLFYHTFSIIPFYHTFRFAVVLISHGFPTVLRMPLSHFTHPDISLYDHWTDDSASLSLSLSLSLLSLTVHAPGSLLSSVPCAVSSLRSSSPSPHCS